MAHDSDILALYKRVWILPDQKGGTVKLRIVSREEEEEMKGHLGIDT